MKGFYKTTKPVVDIEKENSSTASITCYHGKNSYHRRGYITEPISFVEIADCNDKIYIHRQDSESMSDFVGKIKTLKSELEKFIEFLSKNCEL